MPRPSVHSSGIKYSCDRQLLSSAHRNITVGAIIAILKAILVLGDATDFENLDNFGNSNPSRGKGKRDDEEDIYMMASSPTELSMETASLSDFAKHTLRHICRQQWVRDRCLQAPDDLLRKGILLDQMLSSKQAQKAHILPGLKSSSLISLGQLCDDNCVIQLTKSHLFVFKNNQLVLIGI